MKKRVSVLVCVLLVLSLSNCSFPAKVAKTVNDAAGFKTTYTYNVEQIITMNCSPCHLPAKGGTKRPYDNYDNVKADIDEIIRRVELEPSVRGFMPMRGTKLSADYTAVLKKWKTDGLLKE